MVAQREKVVCFGEVLLRLGVAPGQRLAEAKALDLVVGGAEANVAVALSTMGHDAHMLSRLPANPLGENARGALRGAGVDVGHVSSGAGRMGLYFIEGGASLRPPAVTYDRAGSAFAIAKPEDFDFAGAFAGARLLHLSGITAALGPGGAEITHAAIAAARAAGAAISFDPNYRALLWNAWDSRPAEILNGIVAQADILFANHRDISLLLGKNYAGETPEDRRAVAKIAFRTFPQLKIMACTARKPVTSRFHRIAARVDAPEEAWQTAMIDIPDIVDRVGTGDAFAAGVLSAWLEKRSPRAMAETGLAMNALKHALHGDFLRIPRAEIEGFHGQGADVQR